MTSYSNTLQDTATTTLTRKNEDGAEQIEITAITSNGTTEISERYTVDGTVCDDSLSYLGPELAAAEWWRKRLINLESDGFRKQG